MEPRGSSYLVANRYYYPNTTSLGLPVRTAEKRPGVVPGGSMGRHGRVWQSHGVSGLWLETSAFKRPTTLHDVRAWDPRQTGLTKDQPVWAVQVEAPF